jgi:flavin reductase (DIM6/NTAB) family NADH-FMN oxidoreductase RutF
MSVESMHFRRVLAHFAAGVTVVTVPAPTRPLGFTATAFSSLSLTPPLALLCAAKSKPTHEALLMADEFGINILAADQEHLARRFADPRVEDRFAGLDITAGLLGIPMLTGTVAGIECMRAAFFDGGDHSIVTGRVEHLWHTDAAPLLHFAGRFAELGPTGASLPQDCADWLVGAPW